MARPNGLVASPLLLLAAFLTACPQTIEVDDGGLGRPDATSHEDAAAQPDDSGSATTDAGEPSADAMTADAGVADGGGTTNPDAAAADATPMSPACIVSPFASCSDPDEAARSNDTWADSVFFAGNHTVGCLTSDEFTPLDHTVTTVLCSTEDADWYEVMLVGCDTLTMLAEIRLHPLTECDSADWDIQLMGEGQDPCHSADGHVACSMDGADRVIQVRVEPRDVVFSWHIGVLARVPNVKLDYALSVRLYR